MAGYARKGDTGRDLRRQYEGMRRQQTGRPLRGGSPTLTWGIEGAITTGRDLRWVLITIDPVSQGDYPEHKQIVAVWAMSAFAATLRWEYDDGTTSGILVASQTVTGDGSDKYVLPDPFIIDAEAQGVWIRPKVLTVPSPFNGISFAVTTEVVPV